MAITRNLISPNLSLVRYVDIPSHENGDEVLIQLDVKKSTIVQVIGTAAGTLKTSLAQELPNDFSNFSSDVGGAVTGNFSWSLPAGIAWVGFDITSGASRVIVRQNPVF